MFGPRALDCDVEPQLTSADTFYSVIFCVHNFDSLFCAPGAGRGPTFSVCIVFHDNLCLFS